MNTTTVQEGGIYSKSLSGSLALKLTALPALPPPKPSFVRTCRCENSWASLKATVDPAKAQPMEPAPRADHCKEGAQRTGSVSELQLEFQSLIFFLNVSTK